MDHFLLLVYFCLDNSNPGTRINATLCTLPENVVIPAIFKSSSSGSSIYYLKFKQFFKMSNKSVEICKERDSQFLITFVSLQTRRIGLSIMAAIIWREIVTVTVWRFLFEGSQKTNTLPTWNGLPSRGRETKSSWRKYRSKWKVILLPLFQEYNKQKEMRLRESFPPTFIYTFNTILVDF